MPRSGVEKISKNGGNQIKTCAVDVFAVELVLIRDSYMLRLEVLM